MAELRRTHPGRFGVFAALPLPDVPGSLTEIAYAYDRLHVDGVGVWTSYGTMYLGDPAFEPMWALLDRRKAVVFVHPTDAACCANPIAPVMSETVVEFAADTTRAIGSLIFSGTSTRYPNIRFIFSHGGGAAPYLTDRFAYDARDPKRAALVPHGIDAELRKFYYDTAFVSAPSPMAALMTMAPASQILLGTDYPYAPGSDTVRELATCGVTADQLDRFERRNALALFVR
jgi:predicted TIM-barrel fold metal-dependent hydrolase